MLLSERHLLKRHTKLKDGTDWSQNVVIEKQPIHADGRGLVSVDLSDVETKMEFGIFRPPAELAAFLRWLADEVEVL
jgi:hypothetical protein